MITSHSHEFTQIMQMKSYHERTLLCAVFTLDLLCFDHFQWHIHGKFSMTRPICLLARRHRDAEGLILYRCVFFLFSFFLLFSTPKSPRSLNGSQPNLDIHSHMIYLWLLFEKFGPKSPGWVPHTGLGKNRFLRPTSNFDRKYLCKGTMEHNIK